MGKKNSSIWNAKKEDLVELARKELGMTMAQANKETVISLREKIRSARQVTTMVIDPLAKIPKGLDKMSLEDLRLEVLHRNLPEMDRPTRAKLIVLIRDDVNMRSCMEASTTSTTDPNQSMSGARSSGQEEDEDWQMEELRASTRRKQ